MWGIRRSVDEGRARWLGCARWQYEVGARAMARAGVGLYGYCLELEDVLGEPAKVEARVRPGLQPVMTWKTRVIGVRDLKAGDDGRV